MSLVGSATGIVRRNGDVYAIPHRVHATEIRYTKRPFTVSTYGGHFKAPEVHGGEKKLTPYHPLAPRSRPHIVFPRSKPSNTSQIVYVPVLPWRRTRTVAHCIVCCVPRAGEVATALHSGAMDGLAKGIESGSMAQVCGGRQPHGRAPLCVDAPCHVHRPDG